MAETRDDNVYRAKLAEQAERYDGKFLEDIFDFLKFHILVFI